MVGFYGSYSGYGGLFGSSSMGNSFMSSFYSNLGQYASVKSGAYAKATRAYYGKNTAVDSTNTKNSTNSTSSADKSTSKSSSYTSAYSKTNTDNVALTTAKTEASELTEAAKKLTSSGKDSVFAKDKEYNKDDAYKAVSNFVKEYNDTVTALGGTKNTSVSNAGNSMKRMTDVMSNSLSKIGITVGKDGKLSVDETEFKKADESKVKSLFNGSGSYAGIVSSSSSRIEQQASNEISKYNNNSTYNNSTYNNSGSYYNYYNSGLLYNGYF